MTDLSPRRIARAFYESYNDKDLDRSFDAYMSMDLVNHVQGGAYDRQAWIDTDKGLFPAFADFSMTVLDQVAEGNKVATRWRLGGKHTGELFGVPASGATAYLDATSVDIVEDGKIVEHWTDGDLSGFLGKLASA